MGKYSMVLKRLSSQSASKGNLVIFGGNGFVGQNAIAAALKLGFNVTSINRSGKPEGGSLEALDYPNLKWSKGDALSNDWVGEIAGADCVVSCVGAFGSNEFMEKINGDANIRIAKEAKDAGVKKFIYVSTVENNLPDFVLKGYFNGKRRAEKAVIELFPETGMVLRPGFMYGTRHIPLPFGGTFPLPLGVVGRPLGAALGLPGVARLRCLPGMAAVLAKPLDVRAVGAVVAAAAAGEVLVPAGNILGVEEIAAAYEQISFSQQS